MSRLIALLATLVWGAMSLNEAQALSVGDASVRSNLGQPLRVTIPLAFDSAGEIEALDTLRVSLEQSEAYAVRGLGDAQFPPGFLDVSVLSTGEDRQLLLTSRKAFLEPASTVLVRVSLGGISIIRQVSLLLDPPANDKKSALALPDEPSSKSEEIASNPDVASDSPPASASSAAFSSGTLVDDAKVMAAETKSAKKTRPRRLSQGQKTVNPPAASGRLAPAVTLHVQPIARFQFDYSFATHTLLRARGLLREPATQATASSAQPAKAVAVAVERPLPNNPEQARLQPVSAQGTSRPDSSTSAIWLIGLLVVLGLAWLLWSRSRKQSPAGFSLLSAMPKVSSQSRDSRRRALPARPAVKAKKEEESERNGHYDFVGGSSTDTAVRSTQAANEPQPAANSDLDLNHLRKRIQDFSRRTVTPELRTRLMVVEAHCDLRRVAAAVSLLEELERCSEPPKQSTRLMA